MVVVVLIVLLFILVTGVKIQPPSLSISLEFYNYNIQGCLGLHALHVNVNIVCLPISCTNNAKLKAPFLDCNSLDINHVHNKV